MGGGVPTRSLGVECPISFGYVEHLQSLEKLLLTVHTVHRSEEGPHWAVVCANVTVWRRANLFIGRKVHA